MWPRAPIVRHFLVRFIRPHGGVVWEQEKFGYQVETLCICLLRPPKASHDPKIDYRITSQPVDGYFIILFQSHDFGDGESIEHHIKSI